MEEVFERERKGEKERGRKGEREIAGTNTLKG